MRVLVDIAHPAHVHFYRYMLQELSAQGHQWQVASRNKDVTIDLLDSFGIPHTTITSSGIGMPRLAGELLRRDWKLLRMAQTFRPDVILTRSPSGTHVGRLAGIPSIFDTDNGRSAGVHYRASAPFATVITTPDCFPPDLGRKQVRYPSYKAMAFLHPNRFTPDPAVRTRLGIATGKRYFIVRLVSMTASHDRSEIGSSGATIRRVVAFLRQRGEVFISSESSLPGDLRDLELPIAKADFHNALAHASLCVGDSGSVSAESAILGVPAIFVSSFAGRIPYIEELANRYHMVQSLHHRDTLGLIDALTHWERTPIERFEVRRGLIIEDKVDLSSWYLDLVGRVLANQI